MRSLIFSMDEPKDNMHQTEIDSSSKLPLNLFLKEEVKILLQKQRKYSNKKYKDKQRKVPLSTEENRNHSKSALCSSVCFTDSCICIPRINNKRNRKLEQTNGINPYKNKEIHKIIRFLLDKCTVCQKESDPADLDLIMEIIREDNTLK